MLRVGAPAFTDRGRPRSPALMGSCSASGSSRNAVGRHLVTAPPACASPVKATLPGFPTSRLAHRFCPVCSSPRAVPLPFRAFSRRSRPLLSDRAPLLGFSAVQRIRSAGVHIPPKVPPLGLRSAFRVFHPLRGLLLLRPCGSVSPRKRPSAFPFRGFPSQRATRAPRSDVAVVPFSRLHGLAPSESPCRRPCC